MNISGLFIKSIVLPLLFLATLLSVVSTLSEQYKVSQLAKLLRNGSISLFGLFFTIFLGVISVQGASAAVTDGVTLKTAKFITGNFIPVIGRMFSDATDTVSKCIRFIKKYSRNCRGSDTINDCCFSGSKNLHDCLSSINFQLRFCSR